MRFSCEKAVLGEAVSVCAHAVSGKSSTQILEGLLIQADGQVTMAGYNYRLGIKRTFDASIYEAGSVVINARLLSDIIRKMPDEIIEIACDDKLMITIQCGASRFNIIGSPAAEYPELPEIDQGDGISLACDLLKTMVQGTVFAVSDNENKPIHTGSLFEVAENSLTLVSVDGYRLAVRKEAVTALSEAPFKFVVPGDALREIARILPDSDSPVHIFPDRKQALFEFEGTLVITRLLEGEFLNWRAAIPADHPIRLQLNRAELVSAIERVSLIISERLKNPVHCIFDGPVLQLQCTTAIGRSYDECTIPDCPEKIEIGFNNRYLLDALRACPDEEFFLELKSGLSPCNIRPVEGEGFLYMVLPVRLKAGE